MKKIIQALAVFAIHFAFILGIFSVLRIIFYLLNYSYFPNAELINFIGGIRFDWMTITLLYAPYLLFFPFLFHKKSKTLTFLFFLSTSLAVILNGIDFEYFKYTLKRTTSDLFTTKGLSNDMGNLVGSFFIDFWYIIILCILFIYLIFKGYSLISKLEAPSLKWHQKALFILILFSFYIIGGRGGIGFRPLNVIYAAQYAKSQNIALVLNTPFTIIKSLGKSSLESINFFTDDKLTSIYNPLLSFEADSSQKKLNVILIITESLSKEYIGGLNSYEGYTPFIDSLLNHSLVFSNAFANGKKSIESLPSILSGIPTLMNESYLSGKYSGNHIESIASVLNEEGYESMFYHGGENGTMGFQAFTDLVGIEQYYGRNEYPKKDDYDGKWGIFDEPFLQFCANDLSKKKQPFFASIFTLSSHHPYSIPEEYTGKFKGGPLEIHKSIQYADYSLKQFFKKIEKEDWFEDALFIITADHSQQSIEPEYLNNMGYYRIPIVFFSPKYIPAAIDNQVTQQNDLFPSIIDFLGFKKELVCFGNSVFTDETSSFSISYLNGIYQFIEGDYFLLFDGTESISFYNWKRDPLLQKDLIGKSNVPLELHENKLKALIQQYNNRLINNQLLP